MTDGCGLISAAAMRDANELFARGEDGRMGVEGGAPGAVQARILNAKGQRPIRFSLLPLTESSPLKSLSY